MRVVRIDHVQLAMPPGQEATASAFYSGLLGIPVVQKPAALAGRGGVWFQDGDVNIHLGVEQDFRPAKKAHPALLANDLDALPGYRRVYVADPFGNRLELMEATI